jgi:hypothetical protein
VNYEVEKTWKQPWPNFKALFLRLPERIEENNDNTVGVAGLRRDLNPGPPEYETGMATTFGA